MGNLSIGVDVKECSTCSVGSGAGDVVCFVGAGDCVWSVSGSASNSNPTSSFKKADSFRVAVHGLYTGENMDECGSSKSSPAESSSLDAGSSGVVSHATGDKGGVHRGSDFTSTKCGD